jgi:hypothetical protein
MLSSEKRAGLEAGARGGKEIEAGEDGGAGPAPAASLVALPSGGARRRRLASITGAGVVGRETSQEPSAAEADEIATGEPVLFSKGDASASGFRPWYWSYERDGGPAASDSAASVTPFPASAPSPVSPPDPVSAPATSTLTSPSRGAPSPVLLAAFGALAVAAGASVFFLAHLPKPVAAPPHLAVVASPPPPAPVASVPAAPAAVPEPAPGPAVTPPEMAELVARGSQMLAIGDIAAARQFFERAAEAGNAAAATAAGKTYDPFFLAETHARGIRGDPVAAARWYRQASAGGDHEADALMKRLMERYAG